MTSIIIRRSDKKFYVVRPPHSEGEWGPYDTKEEAADDVRGVIRTMSDSGGLRSTSGRGTKLMARVRRRFGMKTKIKKASAKAKPVTKKKADAKPAEDKVGLSRGRMLGLGVIETWNKLLGQNDKKRLTDDEIMEFMLGEFDLRKTVQPVARIRCWYNAGKYHLGVADKKLHGTDRSVGYDKDGAICTRGEKSKPLPKRKVKGDVASAA